MVSKAHETCVVTLRFPLATLQNCVHDTDISKVEFINGRELETAGDAQIHQ